MHKIILPSVLLSFSALSASSVDVTFESFLNPSTFSVSSEGVDFRFAELFSPTSANTSTHIILEGLYPLESDSSVYSSNYYAVDINSGGASLDSGVVYMNLPEGAQPTDGSVSSPIVGIVARQGGWDNFAVQTPSTTLGGSTGTSTYDSTANTLSISVSGGDYTASNIGYNVVDSETIELNAFTLSGPSSSSLSFASTTLARDGGKFAGVVASTDASVGYENLLYELVLDNIEDLDLDGIPDIVDDSVVAASIDLEVGAWKEFASLGNVYGSNAVFGYSPSLKFIYIDAFPYIWQPTLGWIRYISSPTSNSVFYYSVDTGAYLYFADKGSSNYVELTSSGSTNKSL